MWRWWVVSFTLWENTAWYPHSWFGWGRAQSKVLIMLQILKQSAQCFGTAQCTQLKCVHCQNRKKCFRNHQQNTLYTMSRRIHSRGNQIFHLQHSIQIGRIPPVRHEATTQTPAHLPSPLAAKPEAWTLNMATNLLHNLPKIHLNVMLSPPAWSSMKFPTRIQTHVPLSMLYVLLIITSQHYRNNTSWLSRQNIFSVPFSKVILFLLFSQIKSPCLAKIQT
jgi:hypothetical protein